MSRTPIDLLSSSDDSDDEIEVLDQYVSAKSKRDNNEEVEFVGTARNGITSKGPNFLRKAPKTASGTTNSSTTTQSFADIASAKAALQAKRCSGKKIGGDLYGSSSTSNASLSSRKRALSFTNSTSAANADGTHEAPINIDYALPDRRYLQQEDSSTDEERKPGAARNLGAKQPKQRFQKTSFGPQRALCTGLFAEYPIILYDSSSDSDDTDSSVETIHPTGWAENDDRFRRELAQTLVRKNKSSTPPTPPRQIKPSPNDSNSPDPKSVRRLLVQRSPAAAEHRGIVPDNRSRSSPQTSKKVAAARPLNWHPFPKLGRSARALGMVAPVAQSTLQQSTLQKATRSSDISLPSQDEASSAQLKVPLSEEETLSDSGADSLPNFMEHPGRPAKDVGTDLTAETNNATISLLEDAPREGDPVVEPSKIISTVSESMALLTLSKPSIEETDCSVQNDAMVEQHGLSMDGAVPAVVDVRDAIDASATGEMEDDDSATVSDQQVDSTSAIVFPDDQIPPSVSKKTDNVAVDEAEEEELPPWIDMIGHLSFKTTDPVTGLPVHDFSIHGGDDSIVYRFRQFAAQSGIPGANHGAFIVFLGAWRLKDESKKLNLFLSDRLTYYQAPTRRPLQAVFKEGESGVTVHLTGEDLHGFKNRCYVPTDALRVLKAVLPPMEGLRPESVLAEGRRKVRVRILGEHLEIPHYEAYHLNGSSVLKPVGHFGIHTKFDYERATTIKSFEMGENCIDIGRYGPFQKQDRKPEDLFVLKAFVFSQLPSEYSFSVTEKSNGQIQNIDISSDVDGTPHEIARSEIPMYVNEVGYSGEFKQNVFIREFDDRVVKYYFIPNETMEIGKPVEMLTDYMRHYEPVRERHGYGHRNNKEGLPSDSESFAARLERNFFERVDVQSVIRLIDSIRRLHDLLYYLYSESWVPIMGKMQRYYDARRFPVPLTPVQWVAVRRISWIVDEFAERKEWLKSHSMGPEDDEILDGISSILDAMQDKSSLFRDVLILDYEGGGGVFDEKSRRALEDEYVEEICFELKDSLPKAFDESVYCSIARELLRRLCKESQKWIVGSQQISHLLQCFYDAAESASTAIFKLIDNGELEALEFSSGVPLGTVLSGSLKEILAVFKISPAFYLQCNTTPKGVRAALIKACPELKSCDRKIEEEIGDRFIMMVQGPEQNKNWTDYQHIAGLGSIPVERSKIGTANVNVMWYIHWQVLYLVDLFASRYCGADGYNVDTLCEKVGATGVLARFVIDRGIRQNDGFGYRDFCHLKEKPPVCQEMGQSNRGQDSKELAKQTRQLPLLSENTNNTYPRGKNLSITEKGTSGAKGKKFLQPENGENWTARKGRETQFPFPVVGIPGEKPNCIYKGPPKINFPGNGYAWPDGWYQTTEVRLSGASMGHEDNYWYPPNGGKRLRSVVEIIRYLKQHKMD